MGCLLVGALLLSCSQEEPLASGAGGTLRCASVIDTRVGEPVTAGTTYRIMAYHALENTNQFLFARTGTYYLKEAVPDGGIAELTACRLDDDGTNPVTDATAGLNGLSGTYYLIFVSPGVKNNPDGSFSVNPRTDKFVASKLPESKVIGPYGRISMATPMMEYRTMIGIDFYKADNPSVDAFEISDLKLVGAGAANEAVKVFPGSRQIEASKEGVLAVGLTDRRTESETDAKGNPLYYQTLESDHVAIVPAIYAPKTEVAGILKTTAVGNLRESDYLYMTCIHEAGHARQYPYPVASDGAGGDAPDVAAAHLPFPGHHQLQLYQSGGRCIDKTGNDWEDGGSEGGTIETPKYTVTLGTMQIRPVTATTGSWWRSRSKSSEQKSKY